MKVHLADFRYDKYFVGENFTRYTGAFVPLEEYQGWETPCIGDYKYEWVKGRLIKTSKMKNTGQYIIQRLIKQFSKSPYFERDDLLSVEARCYFEIINVVRIPDFAYFTKTQVLEASTGKNPVPPFVIEVISQHDKLQEIEIKLDDYKKAGVVTAWLIMPKVKKIRTVNFQKKK